MNETAKKIVLAGGSGFLGRALAGALARERWDVVVLTRQPGSYRGAGRPVHWDGASIGPWVRELDSADALVNLAGKNVNCQPTRSNRREILNSRVDSVRVLGDALRAADHPPAVWVQASSLAVFGDAGDTSCHESSPVATGFPADVCTAWESAFDGSLTPGTRGVVLRIGFVLGRDGGALPFLARLTRFGLGGPIGNGRQWISWLHLDDMLRIFLGSVTDPRWEGVYNATAPNPVTNAGFMWELRGALGRPWSPRAPAPAVWAGAWLLGSDPAIALTGRRCTPDRLARAGFGFLHPDLHDALADLYP